LAVAGYVGRVWALSWRSRRLLPPEEQDRAGWK
jgi:hypothetical protein